MKKLIFILPFILFYITLEAQNGNTVQSDSTKIEVISKVDNINLLKRGEDFFIQSTNVQAVNLNALEERFTQLSKIISDAEQQIKLANEERDRINKLIIAIKQQ